MTEFLEGVSKVAVLVFVVACMAAAGLGLGVRELAAPLGRTRLVLLAVLANFVLAPAVGAILMSVSTIVVALNAQLLRRVDLRPQAHA